MSNALSHLKIALIVVAVLLAGCGPDTYTLSYAVTLYDEINDGIELDKQGFCYGVGGYDDMSPGQQVRILNGSGDVIGVAELSNGVFQKSGTIFSYIHQDACTFSAKVELPYADVYQIEGRGNWTVTFEELKESDWILDLELGFDETQLPGRGR